jgi:hypothetical protein
MIKHSDVISPLAAKGTDPFCSISFKDQMYESYNAYYFETGQSAVRCIGHS